MSLVKRETSPAQVAANRANSLQSTGPRTEAGKAASSRNALKPQGLSSAVLLSLQALGEDPAEFHHQLEVLSESMRPRDGWEAAWVQDIAMLRRRLDRLQRAEAGVLAVRRKKQAVDRKHASLPPSGLADLRLRQQIPMVGFTGLPDSPWKFRQVLDTLHGLRDLMRCGMYEADGVVYFNLLYGKNPGLVGATLRGPFEALSRRQAKEEVPDGDDQQRALAGC